MKIYFPLERRAEAVKIIEAHAGVKPAAHGSPGYEIPVKGHKYRGRVHIHFCSEGIEIHRDMVIKGKHKVMHRSTTAKEVFEILKFQIEAIK